MQGKKTGGVDKAKVAIPEEGWEAHYRSLKKKS